jgi:hypothetical protein
MVRSLHCLREFKNLQEGGVAKCEVCDCGCVEPIAICVNDVTHTYDSLECAIVGLAPRCANCGELVVSRGVSRRSQIFCADGCAEAALAADPRVQLS